MAVHAERPSPIPTLLVIALLGAMPQPVAGAQQAAPQVAQAAAPPPLACSRTWVGAEAEIEQYLTSARIVRMDDVPIGVTKPQRATLEPGGPVARFAWKALPPQRRRGFVESYKAEVAAYALDRLLEMHMVPPVVERTVEGKVGAAIMWIEQAKGWDMKNAPRGPEPEWSRQVSRMKLFDQLIGNIDRNQGNLLYDADWHLLLIDHSRAFTRRKSIGGIAAPRAIDAALWRRIDALTPEALEGALGEWLTTNERDAILARRDRMRKLIAQLVKRNGEARTFFQ